MAASSPQVGAAIRCAAGLYQLTPFKRACLTHCRSPLGFLMTHWRDGTPGALQMGMRHGAYCLGFCWALMCVLFVAGAMNLVWVATLALFVFLEKIGRRCGVRGWHGDDRSRDFALRSHSLNPSVLLKLRRHATP